MPSIVTRKLSYGAKSVYSIEGIMYQKVKVAVLTRDKSTERLMYAFIEFWYVGLDVEPP